MSIKYNDNGTFKDIKVKVGDNIPVGAEFDYDGNTIPVGYEEVDNPNNYSTEEVRIGTWIDGKPLYRKTITSFSTVTDNNYKYLTFFTDNTINLINSYGKLNLSIDSNNIEVLFPTVNVGFGYYSPIYKNNSGLLYITTGLDTKITKITSLEAIIEYTKTTD